jgi:biotin carboxylase
MGYQVALLGSEPEFSPSLVADFEQTDLYDRPRALEAGLELARRVSVRGVLAWTDFGVELVAALAERLGLPGPSPTAARGARDKHAMRSALKSQPDLIPRFRRVSGLSELREAAAEIGFPAVLKPRGASGSRGILQIDADTDLERVWERAGVVTSLDVHPIFGDFPGEHIYEERLGGSEHSIDGFVFQGAVRVAGITDKWVTPDYYVEYEEAHPSVLPETAQQSLIEAAERIIAAIGLDDCPFHLECRLLEDGSVKLLEIAARPGGGCIASHLVPLSTGIPFAANCVRIATGQPPAMDKHHALFAGRRSVLAAGEGAFEGLDGVEDALRMWGVEAVIPERPLGAAIVSPKAEALSSTVASVVARCGTQQEVRELLERAVAAIKPRVTVRANAAAGADGVRR